MLICFLLILIYLFLFCDQVIFSVNQLPWIFVEARIDWGTLVNHSNYLNPHLLLSQMGMMLTALIYTHDYGRDK